MLRFFRIGIMKRRDLAMAVAIPEKFNVKRVEMQDLATKMILWRTESCGKRPRTVHGIQTRNLNYDRPPSATATTCLGEFTHLDNVFDHSTLGTACCSCGKSVKLTGLGKIGQIMQPVSSLEISKNVDSYFRSRN